MRALLGWTMKSEIWAFFQILLSVWNTVDRMEVGRFGDSFQ